MCLLGNLHVLLKAGEEISHACRKGGKLQRVMCNYAFDRRAVYKETFLFLCDIEV